MSVATDIRKERKKKMTGKVPDYLIYETVKGNPIYYKGYKNVLNGTKTLEQIRMESTEQAWLKAQITAILVYFLTEKGYEITVGELGLILSKEDKRGADISIFKAENIVIDKHFSTVPPEIVIELDIAADTEDINELDYVMEKIEDYHRFGIKKVIWVFSNMRKVMVATPSEPWLTHGWNKEIEVMEGLKLNIEDIMAKRRKMKS